MKNERVDMFTQEEQARVNVVIQSGIHRLAPLVLGKGQGFENFTPEDITSFYTTPSEFSLRLKKEKGKGILYGADHIKIRQSFFNDLPEDLRLHIAIPKLEDKGLISKIASFLTCKSSDFTIIDITDIGVSHSIYKLSVHVNNTTVSLVIKYEVLPHQSFYCQLLDVLGWPSYRSTHFKDAQGAWEFSEYLGEENLSQTLLRTGSINKEIETQLIKHAALGDVLGRGDRHFDNYIVRGHYLYPLDIAYLFWEGNEDWTKKYVMGGMYEINYFSHAYPTLQPNLDMNAFYKIYQDTRLELLEKKELLINKINQFYWLKEPETQRKVAYMVERLESPSFFEEMKSCYSKSLQEMEKRVALKERLKKQYDKDPSTLTELEKMYVVGEAGRWSTLYLWEDHNH